MTNSIIAQARRHLSLEIVDMADLHRLERDDPFSVARYTAHCLRWRNIVPTGTLRTSFAAHTWIDTSTR
jgi:hypothetical protein